MEDDKFEVIEMVHVIIVETKDNDVHLLIASEPSPSYSTGIDGLIPEKIFSIVGKRKNAQIIKNPMKEILRLGPNLDKEDVPMTISLCGVIYNPTIITRVNNYYLPIEFMDTLIRILAHGKKIKIIEPKYTKNTK